MSKEKKVLEDLINDFKMVRSNKFNIHQSKLYFMAIMYEIILDKNIFHRNSELKEFINNIYLKSLDNKIGKYKDYLFDSRTILGARIQKDIYLNLEYDNIIELSLILEELLKSQLKINKKINVMKQKTTSEAITEWSSYFRNKD